MPYLSGHPDDEWLLVPMTCCAEAINREMSYDPPGVFMLLPMHESWRKQMLRRLELLYATSLLAEFADLVRMELLVFPPLYVFSGRLRQDGEYFGEQSGGEITQAVISEVFGTAVNDDFYHNAASAVIVPHRDVNAIPEDYWERVYTSRLELLLEQSFFFRVWLGEQDTLQSDDLGYVSYTLSADLLSSFTLRGRSGLPLSPPGAEQTKTRQLARRSKAHGDKG